MHNSISATCDWFCTDGSQMCFYHNRNSWPKSRNIARRSKRCSSALTALPPRLVPATSPPWRHRCLTCGADGRSSGVEWSNVAPRWVRLSSYCSSLRSLLSNCRARWSMLIASPRQQSRTLTWRKHRHSWPRLRFVCFYVEIELILG